MKLVYFGKRNRPVLEFIEKLNPKDRAKVLACLKSIEDLGFECPRVDFKPIDGKLWEIKIKTASSGYRIFYAALKKDRLILLHAYKKQSQKAPRKEIEVAQQRLLEAMDHESFYVG